MEADYSQGELLHKFEERLPQPNVRNSPPEIANLLADEFIEFGSSGRVFNKQQTIESLQHKSFARISITEFNTSVLAVGVILLIYRVIYRVAKYNTSTGQSVNSLRSSVWKLTNERWKIVFHQGTLTSEP